MLTDLDAELFPDDCEVVSLPLHNRHVYLLQKNGSNSLRTEARIKGYQILRNQDLQSLDAVDIYLRDPAERYVSGINTFVQHLMRDHHGIDRHTCESLALRYNFLNRHYLPQWHWLVNLARFVQDGCMFRLHPLDHLSQVTQFHLRTDIPLGQARLSASFLADSRLELWFLLDRILLGRCGQTLTWKQILHIYQEHPAQPLRIVQQRMEAVRHVLC